MTLVVWVDGVGATVVVEEAVVVVATSVREIDGAVECHLKTRRTGLSGAPEGA